MKPRLLLTPMILAMTAAAAAAQGADAQAHAAALLSRPYTAAAPETDRQARQDSAVSLDAHARAAALLGGLRPEGQTHSIQVSAPSVTFMSADAQAQAAALLSGRRAS
jgi:hypothetical protein